MLGTVLGVLGIILNKSKRTRRLRGVSSIGASSRLKRLSITGSLRSLVEFERWSEYDQAPRLEGGKVWCALVAGSNCFYGAKDRNQASSVTTPGSSRFVQQIDVASDSHLCSLDSRAGHKSRIRSELH